MLLHEILPILEELAPLSLAESWDNVGLLAGDANAGVERIMTCLTLTDSCVAEAIDGSANLIVCHHPIPFKPLSRINSTTSTGRILLRALRAGLAIYSPHTAWDNAALGINQQLAHILRLHPISPLQISKNPALAAQNLGMGRMGDFGIPTPLKELLQLVEIQVPKVQVRMTHEPEQLVSRIGIVCGSGGSMVSLVAERGCDAMLTGEATYHQCLEAESLGVALIMIGHHASEFFAMKTMADLLSNRLPSVSCWAAQSEFSPF